MKRRKFYIFTIIFVVGLLILGGWFVLLRNISRSEILRDNEKENDIVQERIEVAEEISEPRILSGSDPGRLRNGVGSDSDKIAPTIPVSQAIVSQTVLRNVPFTSQAPSGNWGNVVYQQGCEEASMLMAMFWVRGKKITQNGAEKAILAISNFEQKNYGEFRDTSIQDTAEIMKDYFDYQNIEIQNDITVEDIKRELGEGNVVIVPVNGQRLGNPFYTRPGPLQHMLVVRGYDEARGEFITNDPGTRRGEGFRYKEDILEAALQDYVTGYKEPIRAIHKSMIVVYPDVVAG